MEVKDFLATAAEYLIDGRVGIIRSVREMPHHPGSPRLFHFVASGARSRYQDFVYSGGASSDRATALAKALGEVLERYSAGLFDPGELPLASFRAAGFPCVRPGDFAGYTPEQCRQPGFPFVGFDDDTLVRWAPATDLTRNEPCAVPAAKVFLPYPYQRARGEQPIFQSITTGLASHGSYAAAAVNAVSEVVERDAFTIMWQARLSMPELVVDSFDDANRELVERFTRAGGDVRVFNITMEHGIPTVLSAWRPRCPSPEMPALVFAASAELDPRLALTKSLEELELMRSFGRWVKGSRPAHEPVPGHDNVRTREDHVNFYCGAASAPLAAFVFASERRQALAELPNLATGDVAEDLRVLVQRIASSGERVLVSDVTSPEIADLGVTVVRAVIPGFHPLVFGHRLRALGGRRLWTVPQALGYPGITPSGGDNPAPHPFP